MVKGLFLEHKDVWRSLASVFLQFGQMVLLRIKVYTYDDK